MLLATQPMSQVQSIRLQNDEFKALQSIYLQEFHAVKESHPQKFTIQCQPYSGKQDEYKLKIMFEFTPNYPHSPPKYELEPITGLTRDNIHSIITTIQDIIHSSQDRPVVYDIVEEVRIWLQEYLVEGKAYEKDEQNYNKKKEEVFEKPKFNTFTPVTIESFTVWKKQFDAKNKLKKVEKKETEIKITGKEWFLGKKPEQIEEDDEQEEEDEDDEDEEQGGDDDEEQKKQRMRERDDVQMNELFNTE